MNCKKVKSERISINRVDIIIIASSSKPQNVFFPFSSLPWATDHCILGQDFNTLSLHF